MKNAKLAMQIDDIHVCTGRFIGLIDRYECRAVINTSDAGKRIYTAESIDIDDIKGNHPGKRFVIATDDLVPDSYQRLVFISPVIRYMSYMGIYRNFRCEDGKEYSMRERQKV